ncbi:MAG: DAK2 domain-containing protein, partial [Propionibacteriaceae bacterium]|nr:DAK2 domain-containing protein [Propionibacteriaceae bacterium]
MGPVELSAVRVRAVEVGAVEVRAVQLGAVEPGPVEPLWAACDAWLRRAEEIISASADALNTLNVFPVSDSDTGSNLKLTLRGVAQAVRCLDRASLDSVVSAAILSAHGNSGAILAEMVTSVCRSLQHTPHPATLQPGAAVAVLMRRVADAASQAVARPVAGTILTVADDAAAAAEQAAAANPSSALQV